MNRTGAIPSASSLLWGIALLLVATPACLGLWYLTLSGLFEVLAIVLGITGVCCLAVGTWAFFTTFDRLAEHLLGPDEPDPHMSAHSALGRTTPEP